MSNETDDLIFWKKIKNFNEWAKNKPSFWSIGAPPIYKFCWKRKLKVLPPYYQSHIKFIFFMGGLFALFMTLFSLIGLVFLNTFSVEIIKTVVLNFFYMFFGFGGAMLLFREFEIKRYSIPKWEDL